MYRTGVGWPKDTSKTADSERFVFPPANEDGAKVLAFRSKEKVSTIISVKNLWPCPLKRFRITLCAAVQGSSASSRSGR